MGFDGRLFRHREHAPVAPDAVTGIVAVCTGPELHFARGSRSGIHRTPVPGRVAARVLGEVTEATLRGLVDDVAAGR